MPINTHNMLRALTDPFTPVRDVSGRLIGCVPKVPDTAEVINGSNGTLFELRIAAQVCVCVNTDDPLQSPRYLDGFIPLDADVGKSADTPRPDGITRDGEDPDLAVGV